jgi:NADPH:quinone reductase-like Zn-dependent oxidoreductase
VKAVRFHRRGGPDVLQVEEIPVPRPGPGEVRVSVRAVALNHLDLWVRRGLPIRMEMPHIGGADFAGTVDAVGSGVDGVTSGDRVIGYPLLGYGDEPFWRCGERPHGAAVILGEQRNGACCEAVVVPHQNLLPMPESLSFVEAAAVPVVFLTAWSMLVERARLRAGETLLVLGAGSGVGTAAIQIGKWLGARVIACTSGDRKRRGVTALGADDVIDYRTDRIDQKVLRLTERAGADVVFEHVGDATWEQSLVCAAYHGRIVTCGATSGRKAVTDLTQVFAKQLSILGVTLGTRENFARLLGLVGAGKLRPVIDSVLPLEECRRGHERLEAGEQFGKIVLRVGADDAEYDGAST